MNTKGRAHECLRDLLELNGTDLKAGAHRGAQSGVGGHSTQEPTRCAPERAPGSPGGPYRVPARLQDAARVKVKAHVLALICPFTACCGSPSAPSWQAPRACKRRKASSVTRHGRHRTSPALHVTRKTRSRRLAVAPLHHGASRCTMEHHDATGVTTPRQTVKASPHRHKWMLSHGAPADPSDPWNSHAAPVSPSSVGR
jgi:hypothetical protein